MRSFVILLLLPSCTHHRHIAEAHELSGEIVSVSAARGTKRAIGIDTPNGVEFQDLETGTIIPARSIDRIEYKRHGQGAIEGITWGGLGGMLIGGLYGYSQGDDHCGEEQFCFLELSAGDKAAFGAMAFGALGGLVGLLGGAMIGSTNIFEYPKAQATVTPVGPRGSVAGMTISF